MACGGDCGCGPCEEAKVTQDQVLETTLDAISQAAGSMRSRFRRDGLVREIEEQERYSRVGATAGAMRAGVAQRAKERAKTSTKAPAAKKAAPSCPPGKVPHPTSGVCLNARLARLISR